MTNIFTARFWRQTTERAIKSAAQASILAIGQDVATFDVFAASWQNVAGFALGGAVLSVLTSVASSSVTGGTPDLSVGR